jgi:hypothetical protein
MMRAGVEDESSTHVLLSVNRWKDKEMKMADEALVEQPLGAIEMRHVEWRVPRRAIARSCGYAADRRHRVVLARSEHSSARFRPPFARANVSRA